MRRTIFDHTPDGLRQRLRDMERQIADLQRLREGPPSYVEPSSSWGFGRIRITPERVTAGFARRTASSLGEVHTDVTLNVNFSGGTVTLAGSDDGSGAFAVDDEVVVDVTRPDATVASFSHDFWSTGSEVAAGPFDLTSLFQTGDNTVRVRGRDVYGSFVESDAYWLVTQSPATSLLLDELEDVNAAAPVDGQALVFDGDSGMWVLGTVGGGGGGGGTLLATKSYNPASETVIDTPGSLTAISTTNLRVSFTVPASGKVIAVLNGYATVGNTEVMWGLLSGASAVAGSTADVTYGSLNVRIAHRVLISGLTAGATLTWDWAHQTTFGSSGAFRVGGNRGQALMEVWAA